MSGDTIALRIGDLMKETDTHYDTVIYIIYDYNNDKWLIRGKRHTQYRDFSYYCDDMSYVENFLQIIYSNYYRLTLSLCNYKNLPLISNNITYELLDNEYNDNTKEFSTILGVFDHFTKPEKISNFNYEKYLKILYSLYNNY